MKRGHKLTCPMCGAVQVGPHFISNTGFWVSYAARHRNHTTCGFDLGMIEFEDCELPESVIPKPTRKVLRDRGGYYSLE